MKKYILFSLLALVFTFLSSADLNAQSYGSGKKKKKKKPKTEKKEKEKKDESTSDDYFDESGGDWTHKLWYGTGGALNYSRGSNYGITRIGLSPMVGYKILPFLSVGPRLSVLYTGYKGGAVDGIFQNGQYFTDIGTLDNSVYKFSTVDLGIGLFARAKVFQMFFFHAELENYTSKFPVFTQNNGGVYFARDEVTKEFFKDKQNQTNANLGVGYNSGMGNFGYEIMILYNVLTPDDSLDSPIDFRVGLTYNF